MTPKQRAAIESHGFDLLRIFPDVEEPYPIPLCKRLRRMELKAHRYAERLCCEDVPEEEQERTEKRLLATVRRILGDREGRVWMNLDPRGYAFKLNLRDGESLHQDLGGYGIVAPEIGPQG